MNNKHIADLTLRLSQALDPNYDVVNMETVLSVIAALEGTTITKEQLETTRLARYINQLRRRTKNDHLAHRAKSLLKKWREMVGIQQQQQQQQSQQLLGDTSVSDHVLPPQQHQSHHHHHHHHHRSQPTSPMASASAPMIEALQHAHTTGAAFSPNSTTRSANLNVHSNINDLAATSASSSVAGKQPTSFANLITGLYGDKKSYGRTSNNPAEMYNIDQSSNSNVAQVIIDIDSNSGCELLSAGASKTQNTTNMMNATPNAVATQSSPPAEQRPNNAVLEGGGSGGKSSKRAKKDKKRKERGEDACEPMMVILDESLSNQPSIQSLATPITSRKSGGVNASINEPEQEPFVPFALSDDKSRMTFPPSNISEILSLSNSSMSAMFPLESASQLDEPNKSNLSLNNNHTRAHNNTNNISNSHNNNNNTNAGRNNNNNNSTAGDLSFAGKFKSLNTSSSNADVVVVSSINSSSSNRYEGPSTHGYNGNDVVPPPPRTISTFSTAKPTASVNSNDSNDTSNASQLDVIETRLPNAKAATTNAPLLESKANAEESQTAAASPSVAGATTAAATTTTAVEQAQLAPVAEKAAPRKRGRKKGSRGVDAVLAKELSLTPQMLFFTALGSGGKKVKTTKELYAEMQNRKLGITTNSCSPTLISRAPMHEQQQQQQQQLLSRPASSCSEPSLQSPRTLDACSTNATVSTVATCSTPDKFLCSVNADDADSDSGTLTSEQSRDSAAIPPRPPKRTISIDSNSNSQLPPPRAVSNAADIKPSAVAILDPSSSASKSSINSSIAIVQQQLRELLQQLPSVPSIAHIEHESITDVVPCTCNIIEIPAEVPAATVTEEEEELQPTVEFPPSSSVTELTPVPLPPQPPMSVTVVVKTETPVAAPQQPPVSPTPSKPKKSIFDLDFDLDCDLDETDPLRAIMAGSSTTAQSVKPDAADTTATTTTSNIKSEPAEEDAEAVETSVDALAQPIESQQFFEQPVALPPPLMPQYPTYQVDEDPECPAKQRFEIQTQKITKFHIEALHNCFIPNVNGNWDNANHAAAAAENTERTYETLCPEVRDGSNVVPKFGSLISERIHKDLSAVQFMKRFKPKPRTAMSEQLYSVPFLGVARHVVDRLCQRHQRKTAKETVRKIKQEEGGRMQEDAGKVEMKCETEAAEKEADNENNKTVLLAQQTNDTDDVDVNDDVDMGPELDHPTTEAIAAPHATLSNNNNNNILLLKDISIDVEGVDNNAPYVRGLNGQNLLAIADTLHTNYSGNYAQAPAMTETLPSVVSLVGGGVEEVPAAAVKSRAAESTSRRSSSCSSSSSLKHTQQSINLKLRRQFQAQKLSETNGRIRKHKRGWQRRSSRNESDEDVDDDGHGDHGQKRKRIKRIKIAINGDVATQMQFSMGSSNNSSDEYNDNDDSEAGENDDSGNNEAPVSSERSENSDVNYATDFDNDRDDDEEENEADNDNEDDVYGDGDGDVEFDEEGDNYSCDYHEVVTRNLCAPSTTGNNHIVLTIKKTPSKTNSPSNSLTAMSPVISNNGSGSSARIERAAITAATNATSLPYAESEPDAEAEMDGEIDQEFDPAEMGFLHQLHQIDPVVVADDDDDDVIIIEDDEPRLGDDILSSDRDTPITPSALVEPEVQIEVLEDSTSLLGACNRFVISPFSEELDPQQRPMRRRRRWRKRKRTRNAHTQTVDAKKELECNDERGKRHHELFFAHELNTQGRNGTQRLLRLSSCSSNCAESDESEWEFIDSDNSLLEPKTTTTTATITEQMGGNAEEENKKQQHIDKVEAMKANECGADDSDCSECAYNNQASEKESDVNRRIKAEAKMEDAEKENENEKENGEDDRLPLENNGLLLSFNNIYHTVKRKREPVTKTTQIDVVDDKHETTPAAQEQPQPQLPNENCDDYNNLYNNNNNNFNLIKYDSSNNASSLVNQHSFSTNNCKQPQQQQQNQQQQQQQQIKSINCNCDENVNENQQHQQQQHNKSLASSIDIANHHYAKDINNDNNVIDVKHEHDQIVVEIEAETTPIANRNHPIKQLKEEDEFQTTTARGSEDNEEEAEEETVLLPYKEYRSGLRSVDEDVDDEEGNNCARIQQFKEWHEVLQLRSYNDELLTVLPYVVLE